MRAINTISVKSILLSIQETFEFTESSAWQNKAIEHIGRGIEIIGTSTAMTRKAVTKKVLNGRVSLPCLMQALMHIEYEGAEVPLNNFSNFKNDCVTGNVVHPYVTAQVNPGYIFFNLNDDSEVTIFYLSIPLDDDGFPLIVDNAFVLEALEWFVIYKLLLAGFKHHTITNYMEAYNMWNMLYPRAQNSLKELDLPHASRFMDMWTDSLTPNLLTTFI